jgi:hypothetical protein
LALSVVESNLQGGKTGAPKKLPEGKLYSASVFKRFSLGLIRTAIVVHATDRPRGAILAQTADHAGIVGKTRSGAVFTADIHGGPTSEYAGFVFEIRGSEGWLTLTGRHPYGFQAGNLELMSNVAFAPPVGIQSIIDR